VRIAIAGLATSHPYTDATTLREHAELVVWEPDPARLATFLGRHPDAGVAPDLAGLLATEPDGVVLTVPTPGVAAALAEVLARDLPCFVNKPAAATAAQLAALDEVVAKAPDRVLSTSVLRFAPALAGLSVPRDEVTSARVTVRHDVGLWATGYNPWQDDPAEGGGTLVTMGLHGVELLVAVLGPAVELVSAVRAVRRYPTLRSEDTGLLLLRWADGVTGVVEVLGASDTESYEVVLHTAAGDERVVLAGGEAAERELGYRDTIAAFLAMVAGAPSPVPWAQTHAVLRALVDARSVAPAVAPA
jgi:predicted dehydrogenase